MPKTLTAKNIASIGSIQIFAQAGAVNKMEVACEVNFGEMGQNFTVDIFPRLTPAQKTQLQTLYDRVKTLLEAEFLA